MAVVFLLLGPGSPEADEFARAWFSGSGGIAYLVYP
jgi:hypothetical protein